ncbi:MAG: DNA translocase FtsK [Candidatus Omnitrophica bacterium]|nr:DNA translocase FtsK [Candidatus Omnitrophota bacterium]
MKKLTTVLKGTIYIFISLIIFLSLLSYSPYELSFLAYPKSQVRNFIGLFGSYLSFAFFFAFGYGAYFFVFYFFCLGLSRLGAFRFYGIGKSKIVNTFSFFFLLIFLSSFLGIFLNNYSKHLGLPFAGIIGWYLANFFKKYLGLAGASIVLALLIIVNALLLFGLFFIDIFPFIKNILTSIPKVFAKFFKKRQSLKISFSLNKKTIEEKDNGTKTDTVRIKPQIKVYTPTASQIKTEVESQDKEVSVLSKKNKEEVLRKIEDLNKKTEPFNAKTYKLPSYNILKAPPSLNYREVKEDIEASIRNLEETLLDFGVEAKVVSVQKGPVVTMYELQPQAGVKINKISVLADDIALAMKSSQVRIVAPLPGRGTVGVEVPNEKKHLVYLREVLEEKAFAQSPSKLTLAIGKDVAGNPVIADLKEMPHLLIAGTTGSGKTVCVNSLIASILFKARPDEVKFILIDPKMVELAHFGGLPHLLHPIISDAKKAFGALNWAVEEMERRYQILAQEGVRNIDAYNKNKSMPYIVIVIDELADLMVVAKENIEVTIQRLAQLSRAVGIHLILATQRPSVDVITGVIKANFPARISFKVSSKVDSRTVLDTMGAEKLLGKGDLLFLKPGAVKMIRAQGCFIDDEDIENLTNFIRAQGGPIYEEGILEMDKKGSFNVEEDELFDEAVKIILQARQASASILQRRLRVGYTRAARLLDLMEKAGIVGPFCGSKPREILVDPQNYLKEKGWDNN